MCFTERDLAQKDRDLAREREGRRRREREARRRQPTTRPRGNQEPDRRDMERGAERLHAVLGR